MVKYTEFQIESGDYPDRSEFDGVAAGGPSNYGYGYARQIKDKAVEIRGTYELHYIPRDSEVHWAAGLCYNDILEMPQDKKDQWHEWGLKNGPYATHENHSNPNLRPYLGTDAEWQAIEDEFDWVIDWWSEQIGPEPRSFESAISNYVTAGKALYDESTGVDAAGPSWADADRAIDLWISSAADTFRSNVWHRMPNIIRRQASVAGVLAHAMAAERDTWLEHRKNLKKIAEGTLTALDAVRAEPADNANANFTILGGVLTVAAGVLAIPTAGASLAALGVAATTIAAGAFTVAAGAVALEDDQRRDVELGDDTVQGVLNNMVSAGSQARGQVDRDEAKIVDSLQATHDRMTDSSSSEREADIPDEELPSGVQAGDFGERTWTPREKFVLPVAPLVKDTKNLPEPPIPT